MKLMTYKKAAQYLDMPIGTLYSLVSQQRIPFVRLGNRLVRFDAEELERFLTECRRGPTANERE